MNFKMEMIYIKIKIFTVLLSLLLILTSCAVQNEEKENSNIDINKNQSDIKINENTPISDFNNFIYKRPNILKSGEEIESLTKRIINASSSDEAVESYKKASEIIEGIDEMFEIACAKYCTDSNARLNKIEMNYWIGNLYYLDKIKYELMKAVDYSRHSSEILSNLNFNQQQKLKDYLLLPFENRDVAIEYYTEVFDTFNDNLKEKSDYEKVKNAFLNEEVMDNDLQIEELLKKVQRVIETRNKKAKFLGFSNFTDIIFAQKNYTSKEAEALIKNINEIALPVFEEIKPQKTKYDLALSGDELQNRLIASGKTISPIFSGMIDDCLSKKSLLYKGGSNGVITQRPIYLNSLYSVFINTHNAESFNDINEFSLLLGEGAMQYNRNSESIDVDEYLYLAISYTSSIIMERFYDVIYSEGAQNARDWNNYQRIKGLMLNTLICEYTNYLYTTPKLTTEGITKEFNRLYKKYYSNYEELKDMCFYLVANEIIMNEKNAYDKLLASEISMELAIYASSDVSLAENRLNGLMMAENSASLKSVLSSSGLSNPFNANTIKKIAYEYNVLNVQKEETDKDESSSSSVASKD